MSRHYSDSSSGESNRKERELHVAHGGWPDRHWHLIAIPEVAIVLPSHEEEAA